MFKQMTAFTFVVLAALGLSRAGGQEPAKYPELEGNWKLVKMEIGGNDLMKKGEDTRINIKNGVLSTIEKKGMGDLYDLAKCIDATRSPKALTLPYKEKQVFYGIYQVKGDELLVCGDGVDTGAVANPETRRPTEFDSKKGLLLTFQRVK